MDIAVLRVDDVFNKLHTKTDDFLLEHDFLRDGKRTALQWSIIAKDDYQEFTSFLRLAFGATDAQVRNITCGLDGSVDFIIDPWELWKLLDEKGYEETK